MRLRKQYKNYKPSGIQNHNDEESQMNETELDNKVGKIKQQEEKRPSKPLKMIRQLMKNPNFNMQLMVILLSLTSDNIQMDRRIDGMTTTIEKVRTITELVNNGMSSMKIVSEVPKNIRRILK